MTGSNISIRCCKRAVLLAIAGLVFSGNLSANDAGAEDSIFMEETVITGNQELPKVLYILPWREMTAESLPQRVLNFDSQSLLTPLYPDEHRRQLKFRQTLKQMAEAAQETGTNTKTTEHNPR